MGLILGIVIPLAMLCCCCCCFFLWRRWNNRVYYDDDDRHRGEDNDEESSLGSRSETMSKTKARIEMEDCHGQQRSSLNEGGPRGQDDGVPQQQLDSAVPQQGPGSVMSYRTR